MTASKGGWDIFGVTPRQWLPLWLALMLLAFVLGAKDGQIAAATKKAEACQQVTP